MEKRVKLGPKKKDIRLWLSVGEAWETGVPGPTSKTRSWEMLGGKSGLCLR